jgi:NitT/TauT family transport system permease protein
VLAPALALCVGLAVWELTARALHVPAYLLPPPSDVARAALADRAALLEASLITFASAALGFVLSGVVGVLVAIVLSTSRWLERGFYPYALVLQTVPIVAIAPLLVLWLGVGFRAVVASAFIVSVFPVIANALAGLRSVDPALRDLFRLYGAGRLATLWKLELPSATIAIATGLRIACGLAVIGAIVGEFVAGFAEGSPGLGILVLTSYRQLRTDLLFAAVLCSALLGVLLFAAVSGGAALLLRRWNGATRD